MKDNPEPLTFMRRGGVALVLGLIMLTSMLANINLEPDSYSQLEENDSSFSNSDVTITYSNGPTSGQSVTGLYTVSFTLGGTSTVSSMLVEISDGVSWTTVTNLTSSPW